MNDMLEKEIPEKLKEAMRAGRTAEISVLRMLLSEIKYKKIEDGLKELTDEKVVGVVQKMARRQKESIEQFKAGKRDDLVKKEEEELRILEKYLPEQLTGEEIGKVVSQIISELGEIKPQDMGKVMKAAMERLKGRADGKVISSIVKEKLNG